MRLISITHLLAASTTPTTAAKTTSGSSSSLIIFVIIAFGLVYFLFLRPQRRRQMQAMRARTAYDLGDEVVAGGMVGKVVRLGDGEVDIEVSDGVIVRFVPGAVQLRSAYLAGPAGRGLGGGAGGAAGRGGMTGSTLGGGGSTVTDVSGTGPASADPGSNSAYRSRSVRRRATASDVWPDASDSPVLSPDDDMGGTTGGDSGPGTSDGGSAPASGDR